ncbi:hypothetical protein TNCV_2064691 [Trichonephila clavipes]|nr:hypothetical protein TNCV_2064691 [Trichonephila clavipes]
MVLNANDRRTSCPCHDEFRGPRSDYVRQVALATTTTTTNSLGVSSANYGKILCPMLLKFIPSDLVLDYNKLQQKDSGSDIQQLLSFLTQS